MSNPTRICPDCGETVEGRPNKIYCNDVCKGRHNRSINLAEQMSVSSSVPVEPAPLRRYPTNNLVTNREEEQEEAEEKARMVQDKASKLHTRFCDLVREMLQSADKILTARRLKRLQNDVDSLSTAYTVHPYLKLPQSQDRSRLKALYNMHDTLKDALEDIAKKNMFQRRETAFEISKKWRKCWRELQEED